MNSPEPFHSPALLEWWLDAATAKLAAPARERIRGEITAHFTDAVERHLRDGCTETEAREAAVRELGDAKSAARRFRRSHLTVGEAEWIEKQVRFSKSKWSRVTWFFPPLFLLLVSSGGAASGPGHLFSTPVPLLGVVFVAYLVAFSMAGTRWHWSDARMIFLLGWLGSFSWMVLGLGVWTASDWWLCALIIGTDGVLFSQVRFWFKLVRIGNIQSELPPSDLVAS